MRYSFISANRKTYSTSLMCRALQVSRSGYYKWQKSRVVRQNKAKGNTASKILEIFEDSHGTYGYRRISIGLSKAGIKCNNKRVRKIMQNYGLKGNRKKKFRHNTTDSAGNTRIFPNLLPDYPANKPGEILASDITAIRTTRNWIYLAVVMDLYNREILGQSIRQDRKSELVLEALSEALNKVNPDNVKLFHSDRGSQYSSWEVVEMLKYNNITQSMSRKGNCYDNAYVESFFKTLKSDLVYRHPLVSPVKMNMLVFEYIETRYNRKRIHSSLGYMSPEEFRTEFELNKNYA